MWYSVYIVPRYNKNKIILFHTGETCGSLEVLSVIFGLSFSLKKWGRKLEMSSRTDHRFSPCLVLFVYRIT